MNAHLIAFGAALWLAAGFADAQTAAPAARPNILWLTAEDICPNLGCYGDKYAVTPNLDVQVKRPPRRCYGDKYAVTPNLDRFAMQAVRYTLAFGITGVCAPNRSCLITGVFPTRLGSHGMRSTTTLPAAVKCFSEYLREAGYYCSNNAKTDYNFAVPKDAWDECGRKGRWRNRFFFGDNGAGLPGMKKWIWEGGIHVPLMVRFPKKWQHLAPAASGQTTGRMVSFVDFAPTVLSLCGAKLLTHLQGAAFLGEQAGKPREFVHAIRDRMAERFDIARVVRDRRYQYHRNFMPHPTWSQFVSYTEEMPTMKAWRQLASASKITCPPARHFSPTKPVEELYDNESDPHQLNNLAADPKHRDTLERLRGECVRWMKATGDLGLLPEHEMLLRATGSTPWEIATDPRRNPLDALLKAATLANKMKPTNVPRLVQGNGGQVSTLDISFITSAIAFRISFSLHTRSAILRAATCTAA